MHFPTTCPDHPDYILKSASDRLVSVGKQWYRLFDCPLSGCQIWICEISRFPMKYEEAYRFGPIRSLYDFLMDEISPESPRERPPAG